MNKFSLRFNDEKLERQYQEYQTATVRKPLLIKVCCLSILWNLMDFIQFLIQNNTEYMTSAIIVYAYAPFILLQILFLLVACFCKPRTTRWILLIQNHLFVFAYCMEYRLFTFEQAKLYTFIIIGTQFVIFLTAECVEMIYQIIVFSVIYFLNMIYEKEEFTYSLVVGTIFSIFIFILAFYGNTQKLKQNFKQHFLEDQWEQIFITLTTGPFMIFEYDDQTFSFHFRSQNKFYDKIHNSQDLRVFLRQTLPQGKDEKNLETFLHKLLSKDQKQSVIKENLKIINHNQESGKKLSKKKGFDVTYSIFIGVHNIIVFQPAKALEGENFHRNDKNKLLSQSYQCKFKLLMIMAKKFILENQRKLHKQLNFNKFKRYCLSSSLYEQVTTLENHNQYLPTRPIFIFRFLNKIKKLYPEKNITIKNNCTIRKISTSSTILAALIIGIIERSSSLDIQICFEEIETEQVEFSFLGYFNKEYFYFIRQKVRQFSIFTPYLYLDQFSNNFINFRNTIKSQKF